MAYGTGGAEVYLNGAPAHNHRDTTPLRVSNGVPPKHFIITTHFEDKQYGEFGRLNHTILGDDEAGITIRVRKYFIEKVMRYGTDAGD